MVLPVDVTKAFPDFVTHGELVRVFSCNIGSIVVNMDEARFADFPDARPQVVVVPESYPCDTIPRDRRVKRSKMIAGIAADGTDLKPLIIVLLLTIQKELFLWDDDSERFRYDETF
jgi:hypothetical protein